MAEHQVLLAEQVGALPERTDLIERLAQLDQRTLRVDRGLAAIDVDLGFALVGLVLVAGIGLERILVELGLARALPITGSPAARINIGQGPLSVATA
ncbi:MAG: hypothetical protein HC871_10930 [Rhizobiales bacterium]|nr:hypothetical protein [Hyphomicrobiales bacterium]